MMGSLALTYFSLVSHFIKKSVIWFTLQIKWLVFKWNVTLECKVLNRFQKQSPEVFCRKRDQKRLKTRACNQKRFKHRCFPVKFAYFLQKPISKNICKRLLQGFVKLSSHGILCLVLQLYLLDICFYRLAELFQNAWILKPKCYFSIWNKVDISNVFAYKLINIKSKFQEKVKQK